VIGRLWLAARLAATVVVAARLARAARRPEPLTVGSAAPSADIDADATISAVIPARDEEDRLLPLLQLLATDRSVMEVIVVDDGSRDGTAALARDLGATVITGAPLPRGWVGKPWALDQGLRAARGDWVVCFDADVEPSPGLARALVERVQADGLDMATVAGRFVCPTAPLRVLHPALLTTLVYRFGPPAASPARPGRVLANGQCTAARRADLLGAGGYTAAAGNITDDVALARSLASRGWRTGLLDGTSALRVRMHTSAGDAWRAWGRSLPLPDVTTVAAQVADGLTLLVTQALPLPRLLLRRADALDLALLVLRAGTLAGTARAYERRDLAYWLSPVADSAAVLRVLWGAIRPGRTWRGRTYPRPVPPAAAWRSP
jgi:dolichol-phosphate mannosyltransferase